MKLLLVSLMVSFWMNAFSQNHQIDINEQVWIPFTNALQTRDPNAFISLHSTDIIRIERNSGYIYNYTAYKTNLEKNWPARTETNERNKSKSTFELRFTERISNGQLAYEVGYFKNEYIDNKGVKHASYGNFHVTLRKENGVWKILVDSDSNLNGAITEDMFLSATPLE